MIVIGIDPHMKSHTAVAVDAASGRTLAETTVGADAQGHEQLLLWAAAWVPSAALPSRTAATSPAGWSATCCPVVGAWCACRPS